MTSLYLLAGMLLLALLTSCGDCGSDAAAPPTAPPVVTPPPAPRVARLEFSSPNLAASQGARKAHRLALRDAPADFELGDIESTSTFLFILRNVGTADLQNVQITCTDPAVVCTPAQIGVLSPEGSGGLTPVIQVKVVHGVSASGLTSAPLLTAGRWLSTLSAQGTTAATGDTVSATATLGANVEIAQFQFLEGSQAEDLSTSGTYNGLPTPVNNWSTYSDFGSIGMPTWVTDSFTETPLIQGDVTLVNTGNAPLIVQEFGATLQPDGTEVGLDWYTPTQVVVLQPGETLAPTPSAVYTQNYPGNWYDQTGNLVGTSPTQLINWVMLRVTSSAQMDPSYYRVAPGVWQGAIKHTGPGAPAGNG